MTDNGSGWLSGSAGKEGDPVAEVVVFISARPDVIETILREHVVVGSGYCDRCRFHLRPERWPCFDARMALLARDYLTKRRAAATGGTGINDTCTDRDHQRAQEIG